MTSPRRKRQAAVALATLLTALAPVTISACGGSEEPASPPPDYEAALADAPGPLAALYEQANEILPGGTEEFDARLRELRGYPVVVNKWASWCGPCRAEFPLLQSAAAEWGDRVAFLGVDANDSTDAARTFLRDHPVPYPSLSDPDESISAEMDAAIALPATAFYDRRGELVHVQQGQYASEEELVADLKRYAR